MPINATYLAVLYSRPWSHLCNFWSKWIHYYRKTERRKKEKTLHNCFFVSHHSYSSKKFYLKLCCRNLLHIFGQLIFDHSWNFNITTLHFVRLSIKTEVHDGFNCIPCCYWSWFFQAFIVNRHLLHHFLISPRFCYCVLLRWLTYHIKQAQLQLRY